MFLVTISIFILWVVSVYLLTWTVNTKLSLKNIFRQKLSFLVTIVCNSHYIKISKPWKINSKLKKTILLIYEQFKKLKNSTTICSISARNTYNKQHLMTILQTWGREAYEDHTPLGREAYEWGRPTVTILLLQRGGEGGGWAHTYCTGLQTNNHALARPASLTPTKILDPFPQRQAIKPTHKG